MRITSGLGPTDLGDWLDLDNRFDLGNRFEMKKKAEAAIQPQLLFACYVF